MLSSPATALRPSPRTSGHPQPRDPALQLNRPARCSRGAPQELCSALILILLGCGGCGPGDSDPGVGSRSDPGSFEDSSSKEREAVLVRVGRFERGAIVSSIDLSTDIEAEIEVNVYAKVGPAYVKELLRKEGDRVSAGDPLLLLDDIDFRIAVRRQESRVLQSRQTQAQKKTALAEAEARQRVQEAISKRAQADFDRAENAMKGDIDVLSAKELTDARSTWEQSRAELEAAGLAVTRTASELELAALEEQAAAIELESAQNDLEQTVVRSTIDGVIKQRHINAGLLVNSSNLLYTITDPTRLIANLRIPQEDLQVVNRLGMKTEFRFDALPGRVYHGSIEAINPSIDPSSGLIKVRARLEETASGEVLPGMFARARIIVASREDAYLLNKRAVVYEEGKSFLFLSDQGVARRMPFEAGANTESQVEVVSLDGKPLTSGDRQIADWVAALRVIMVGQDRLRDGDRVKVAGESS